MSTHIDQIDRIESDLLSLPREARARIAQLLMASLEDDPEEEGPERDADWELSWAEEAERRHQLYASGKMKGYSPEEMLAEARARRKR